MSRASRFTPDATPDCESAFRAGPHDDTNVSEPDCYDCLDGLTVSNTCDDCGLRHCSECDSCDASSGISFEDIQRVVRSAHEGSEPR